MQGGRRELGILQGLAMKSVFSKKKVLPFSVELDNAHCLQLLENMASNTATALTEMWWSASISFATTIDSSESTNSKTSS